MRQKVSVITVCYNCKNEIEQTVMSVISQTYPYIEYLIIDGNSSDGTLDIVYKYKDKIKKIISEPDNGIFDAMNKGINIASGDWIIFMNAGDVFYSKDVISAIFEKFDENQVGVIFGDALFVKETKSILYKSKPFYKSNVLYPDMGICHQAIFVKMDLAKQFKFDTSFKLSADYNMIYNIYKYGVKFLYKAIPICKYDLSGVSTCNYYLKTKEKINIINSHHRIAELLLLLKARFIQTKIYLSKYKRYF